jgi:cation transporter-like permease
MTVLRTFFETESGHYIVYLLDLLFILVVLIFLARNYKEEEFLKTLKEFQLTLLIVAVVVNITGSMLNAMRAAIGERLEVYTVYPALITTMGSFGSIVGSTATTKLFTGLINPSLSSMKRHMTQILSAWAASMIMFTIYTGITSASYNIDSAELSSFLAELLTTNILAASVMACIAYAIAILTFRRALDPDNYVIPIESSIADAVTTIFLFVALGLFS